METITAKRRLRSPKAFIRKDARNLIYGAMYGRGDRRSTTPPAYDPNRKHDLPERVDWDDVQKTLEVFWRKACFDELTANKIVSDFNFYAKAKLTRAELEKVS